MSSGNSYVISSRSNLPKTFYPADSSFIIVNNRKYRGKITAVRTSSRRFKIINELDIENYLKGVIPAEMPRYWSIEALKAQAVVARTYALWRSGWGSNNQTASIIQSTVSDQVYKGASIESETTNYAVESTKGEVITYMNGVVPAYFHSSCGGITERASNVWPEVARQMKDNTVWQNVNEKVFIPTCDPYCISSLHNAWTLKINSKILSLILRKKYKTIRSIDLIDAAELTEAGRIKNFRVTGRRSNGAKFDKNIDGNTFRLMIGAERLRSLLCEVRKDGQNFIFQGRGWGHGVGLCQWGAKYLSDAGFNYKQIIEYYYPGTIIQRFE